MTTEREAEKQVFIKEYLALCDKYKFQFIASVQVKSFNSSVFQGEAGLEVVEIKEVEESK